MIGETKTCTSCGETKDIDAFNDNGRGKKRANCRDCQRIVRKKSYAKNGEKQREQHRSWYAQNIDSERRKARERMKSLREEKPDEIRQREKEWKKRNPDKVQGQYQRWYEKNQAKAKLKVRSREKKIKQSEFKILRSEQHRLVSLPCFACGESSRSTIEHLIPIDLGGDHRIGNLYVLCKSCNSSKHKLTWVEWKYSARPRAREVFPGLWEKRQALKKSRPHAA